LAGVKVFSLQNYNISELQIFVGFNMQVLAN